MPTYSKRMTKEFISTLKTNMAKENVSLDFRPKKTDETKR